MKTVTIQLTDSIEKALKSFAKGKNKSLEQIVLEKILTQIEEEKKHSMKQAVLKALLKSESLFFSPHYFLDLISDPKVNRENVFQQLTKKDLGQPLSEIIIKERGVV